MNTPPPPSKPSPRRLELLLLSDPECQDPALVGAKSATLARLFHQLPDSIPPGIALPPSSIDELTRLIEMDSRAEVAQALLDALGERDATTVKQYAVRSSALDEDSARHSFAGQYETALGVANVHDIIAAIETCVRSAASARVTAYRDAALQGSVGSMAVLIQEMVPADRSGVAFTINPLTGQREIVINAAYGLGDLLVSGEVTPDEIIVANSGRPPSMTIGSKRRMSVLTRSGVIYTAVPESLRVIPCLSEGQIDTIATSARSCEAALGYPVDIEWALSGRMMFVLQARPITAILSTGTGLT